MESWKQVEISFAPEDMFLVLENPNQFLCKLFMTVLDDPSPFTDDSWCFFHIIGPDNF